MSNRIRLPAGEVLLNVNFSGTDGISEPGNYLNGWPFRTLSYARYWALHHLDSSSLIGGTSRIVLQLAAGQVFGELHSAAHGGQHGAQGGDGLTIRGAVDANGHISVIRGTGGKTAVGVYFGEVIHLQDLQLESQGGNGLDCVYGGNVYLSGVRWGACTSAHCNIIGPSTVQMRSGCSIVGNASWHVVTQGGFFFRMGHPLSVEADLSMARFVQPFGPTMVNFQGPPISMNGHTYQGGAPVVHPFVLAPDGGFPGGTA